MNRGDVHTDEMFDDDPTSAAFARDLREAAQAAGPPVVHGALAAVLDGSVAAPSSTVVPMPGRTRRSRRLRVVVGGAVFGLTVGGLGVAGALPGPVQRQVSRAGRAVGVELPAGTPDATTSTTTSTTAPTSTTVRRSVTPATTTTVDEPGASDDHRRDDPAVEPDDRGQGDGHEDRGSGDSDGQRSENGTTSTTEGHGEGVRERSQEGAAGRDPIGSEENHHRA